MLLDIIPYLSKNKGLYLSNIGLDLRLVDPMYRFDLGKFDMLTYDYADTRIFGIKNLKVDIGLKGLQKIVDDAEWLNKYNGHVITLIPAANTKLHNIFDDVPELITTKYYIPSGKDYIFLDDLREYEEMRREQTKEKTREAASNFLTSPRMVDFVLKQFEKKSPAIKILRGAINAYTGPKTRKW